MVENPLRREFYPLTREDGAGSVFNFSLLLPPFPENPTHPWWITHSIGPSSLLVPAILIILPVLLAYPLLTVPFLVILSVLLAHSPYWLCPSLWTAFPIDPSSL